MRIRRCGLVAHAIVVGILSTFPSWTALPYANVVTVRVERLIDTNGDRDGQLDTNETAELTLSFSNKRFAPARNRDIRLSPRSGRIDAISPAVFHGVLLAPGATVSLRATQMHVSAAADRGGASVICQNPGAAGIHGYDSPGAVRTSGACP